MAKRAALYTGTGLDIMPNETPGTKDEKPFELTGTLSRNGKPIKSRVLLTVADVESFKARLLAENPSADGEFARDYLNENGFAVEPVEDRASVLDSLFAH